MSKMIFVKPKDGLKIRNAEMAGMPHLNPDGDFVPWSVYWQQLELEGSITISDGPPAASRPSPVVKPDKTVVA